MEQTTLTQWVLVQWSVFYVTDGDEGRITMIDKDTKVVADFPHSPRNTMAMDFEPISGHLILFLVD